MEKFEAIVIGNYLVETAEDKKDAKEQALHHFHNALNRWANGKDAAAQIFEVRITKVVEE